MIAKITSGKDTAGLIRYLFDTKKAKDHVDPHLVASWDGFAPDPGRTDDFDGTKKLLVADLNLHVKQARRLGRAPEKHTWHCSIRAATTDRHLSDEEWADIARRVVAATGIAPEGDPDGCRWVAVRHAPDHIHIAATKVRADLRTARHWNDYLTADRELAAIEKEYGLFRVVRGDRTAAKRPTRAELEKARRAGHDKTDPERLRDTVRTAVAASSSMKEFIDLLSHTDGMLVEVVYFPSGDVRGYKVALEDDANGPIWYSGSKLAPDLSFPKIQERLKNIAPQPTDQPGRRRPNPWHQATAATERIPHHLAQRRPPQQTVDRHIRHLRHAVPDHAEQVIEDTAFDALTATLAEAEAAGHDPERLLQQAADQRALDDADSATRVLIWRIQCLSARPAPSARARAAQARSTAKTASAPQRPSIPAHEAAALPAPQQPQARRR